MVTIYKILQVIVAPQKQGGPNGGYFYANNGMIDIEEDQELMKNGMQRLKHLNILLENNLITQGDYDVRKSQIVDELTGTSTSMYMSRKRSNYSTLSTGKSHRLSTNTLERSPFHRSPGSSQPAINRRTLNSSVMEYDSDEEEEEDDDILVLLKDKRKNLDKLELTRKTFGIGNNYQILFQIYQ